ncbi:DUF3043 domain-containing protein [Nocardioides sp.]|uniref:DUF3043 domain-containing protein n=1 Tax=Nocardioides sp. TaxID=35761 RepID=UPI00271FC742|nr:DUF3043 domain-containing protein [Nocardioides sp.]MDO9455840.1 DUF3043 domain-containing protein [Nocardioides sp.]
MKLRRRKSEEATSETVTLTKAGGKGRPTPTRKEAEAAARARAKVPRTRKEQMAAQRAAKGESSQKIRQGMKDGDERYLLARDKGPVRRFIRDFVDARFGFAEIVIPLMFVAIVYNPLIIPLFAVLVVDLVVLRLRLRKELTRRFPDESLKGTTYYSMTRAMQMKFMRLPKSKVKIGTKLPETYR